MTFRASSIERVSLCPGSARLEAQCPPSEPTADTTFGTRVHAGIACEIDIEDLTPDERACVIRLRAQRDELLIEWQPDTTAPIEVFFETEILLGDLSGHPDEYFISGHRAFIPDFKSVRWGDHTESAANLQLRSYAVLVQSVHPIVWEVTVALIQDGHAAQICNYSEEDLADARLEIFSIIEAAQKPDAPLNPSEKACRWCRAKAVCPALHSLATKLSAMSPNKDDVKVIVAKQSGEALAALLTQLKPLEWFDAAVKEESKRRLSVDPDAIPGWMLAPGKEIRRVSNVTVVTERLAELGSDWAEITKACSITLSNVERLAREASGLKGKLLKTAVDEILSGAVEVKQSEPSLVRFKEVIES